MRTQKTIILAIFILAALFAGFSGMAQSEEKLLCDETTAQETKTSYKITTDNDFIPLVLVKEYGSKAKSYTVKNKTDRHGKYIEYVFYFPIELKEEVNSFILNLKRPKN